MHSPSYEISITSFVALFGWCFLHSLKDVSAYSQYRPLASSSARAPWADAVETAIAEDHNIPGRRVFFQAGIAVAAAALVETIVPEQAGAIDGIISSKYCAYGEGNDCEDLAGGSPYILELQRKSAANKEANIKSAEYAFYAKNYPDWFAAVGKTMVQKESDGTFIVVDNAELAKLWDQNKISVKSATTMGGRVKDVTQKPMLVIKE